MQKFSKHLLHTLFIFALLCGIALVFKLVTTPPHPSSPASPEYSNYIALFHNAKCVAAGPERYNPSMDRIEPRHIPSAETILSRIDKLGISYEEALELFEEARFNLVQDEPMRNMIGVMDRCRGETLEYFDLAISTLQNELSIN